MTAKELLLSAKRTEMMAVAFDLVSEQDIATEALNLADYIFATVKPDDDEPITLEWLQRSRLYGATEGMFRFQVPGTDVFIEWFSGDTCELIIGKSIIPNIDTRGQFRMMCRALGITLPEVTV